MKPFPARYAVRPKPDGDYGVFDTFTQTFVEGERHKNMALAIYAAARINRVYERAMEP